MNSLLFLPVLFSFVLLASCTIAGYLKFASLEKEHLVENRDEVYRAIADDGSANVLVIWGAPNIEATDGFYTDAYENSHPDILLSEVSANPV